MVWLLPHAGKRLVYEALWWMAVFLCCPDRSVRHLELGSNTDVGRGLLGDKAVFVSKVQATIVVTESGVEIRSLGSNPTGMRSDADAPWSWLSKGKVATAHPSFQLCLDKKNQSTTLLTFELAAGEPAAGEPAAEEAAAEASVAPSSESAGSDVHITSTRTRDERDAEARKNAIDVEAIDDGLAPLASTEPAGKRVKAEPISFPTAPLPKALPTASRPSADAEFDMLESAGFVSFGGRGVGSGSGGGGLGFPPAAARAVAAPAARATPQPATEPIVLDDSDETDEDDEEQQQRQHEAAEQQREAAERRAQAAARTRSGLYAPTPLRPLCKCDSDCP